MVLYVVGLVGLSFMKAKLLGDSAKEKFVYEIYLKDGVRNIEIMQLKKSLDAEDFVKRTVFKDKEDALKEYKALVDPNEDFTMTIGESPIPQNIDVYFYAEYNHPDSLKSFQESLQQNPIVSDFRYPSDLLYMVHKNVNKISFGLLIVSGLLLIVAIGLINNTIRLRVYAQRFLIKTMQLVGASNWFIRKPFLASAFAIGLLSGLIAVVALGGTLKLIYDFWPAFYEELYSAQQDLLLYAGIVGLGIGISYLATYLAVGRFLRLKTDRLYY